jgi:hypothetical protein
MPPDDTHVTDLFNPRTLRRLARSAYAPIPAGSGQRPLAPREDDDMAPLRTDVLARLLVERLASLGPMTEAEALDVLDARAPGRGRDVVRYAVHVGLVRRVIGDDDEPDTLKALGAPPNARRMTGGGKNGALERTPIPPGSYARTRRALGESGR